MTQTFDSEYGRESITVDDQVPAFSIGWLMGRIHVTTPDADVEADFRQRLAASVTAHPAQLADDVVRYALWVHAENRAEYGYVMGGRA